MFFPLSLHSSNPFLQILFSAIKYTRKPPTLKAQNPPLIIHAPCASSMPDCPVQRHNRRHRTVNLLRRLLLIRLDVPRRVRLHKSIFHHPPQHRTPAIGNIPLQGQRHQPLRKRRHILEPLPERNHRKPIMDHITLRSLQKSLLVSRNVNNALCSVVGSERTYQKGWDSSQQAKSVRQAIALTGRFTEMGTHFLILNSDEYIGFDIKIPPK